MARPLSNYIPPLKALGIPNLVGAFASGSSIQFATGISFPAGGVFTFAALGLSDMADALFVVIPIDNTTANAGKITAKSATGFTCTGPTAADSMDFVVIGRLKGQVA